MSLARHTMATDVDFSYRNNELRFRIVAGARRFKWRLLRVPPSDWAIKFRELLSFFSVCRSPPRKNSLVVVAAGQSTF